MTKREEEFPDLTEKEEAFLKETIAILVSNHENPIISYTDPMENKKYWNDGFEDRMIEVGRSLVNKKNNNVFILESVIEGKAKWVKIN